jgi:hypothetical protein
VTPGAGSWLNKLGAQATSVAAEKGWRVRSSWRRRCSRARLSASSRWPCPPALSNRNDLKAFFYEPAGIALATNDSELTPRDPDWQRKHCEAHGMRLLRTNDDTTGGFTVTVTLSNELRLENQTKNKNNTLISNTPNYLGDPQWRTYSQAAIAAEKRYIKKTTISAITKERDEKIKKLEAVMEEKIKAL